MMNFITKNQKIDGIVWKTENVIIQEIQRGDADRRCYLIGNGLSMSVDAEKRVTKHDPGMTKFKSNVRRNVTVYAFYFTFECGGLEKSSEEIAKFVNEQLLERFEQIFLIGHSKCGVCLYNASRYIQQGKVTLVTISAPFKGTVVADKEYMENILKYRLLTLIYNMIFSDHNVDRDIKPDSEFIRMINSEIQTTQSYIFMEHINIIAMLDDILSCQNLVDFFLYIWNKAIKLEGDGIVPISSQKTKEIWRFDIKASHASSLKRGIAIVEDL